MTDPYLEALNPEQEERYLLALLLSGQHTLRDDALATVAPDQFWNELHGQLWRTAQVLREQGTLITCRTLLAALPPEARGAGPLLNALEQIAPEPTDYAGVLREVGRCADARRGLEFAEQARQAFTTAPDFATAYGRVTEKLDALTAGGGTHGAVRYDQLLIEFYDAMRADRAEFTVVPTPWPGVNDKLAGGLHGGRMVTVSGRPGDGKSIAGAGMAQEAARHGHAAAVFSVEMGKLEVTGRLVADGASIDLTEISSRALSRRSWDDLDEYTERARHYPLFVDDRSEVTVAYIRAVCRALKKQFDLKVAVVDYLQLLKGEAKLPREQQVANMSRSLKLLSRELDIAVVVAAQLNRKAVDRGRPTPADLRESGAIEQDSDVVVLLSRQYFTEGDMTGKPNGFVNVDVAKNRMGAPGCFEMRLLGQYSRITE